MKLGLVTYNIAHDWDLDTLLSNCAELGYEAVELRTTHAHGVELSLTPQQREQVREKFEQAGIVLWGLGTTCEFHSPDADELERNVAETLEWIKLAADLGARGVKVRPNALPEGVPEQQTLSQIADALNRLAPAAAEAGVELWLEVHGRGTSDPRRMAKIMQRVPAEHVGVVWNCNYPSDLIDGKLEPGFELLKSRILSVHLHDLHEPYPYAELFQRLRQIGYDRYCLAEIQASSDPVRVLRYFKVAFDCLSAPR